MRPTVRGLMDKYLGNVEIVIMDYHDRSLADYRRKYGTSGHPSFAAINSAGEVVDVIIGPVPAEQLEALVAVIAEPA